MPPYNANPANFRPKIKESKLHILNKFCKLILDIFTSTAVQSAAINRYVESKLTAQSDGYLTERTWNYMLLPNDKCVQHHYTQYTDLSLFSSSDGHLGTNYIAMDNIN